MKKLREIIGFIATSLAEIKKLKEQEKETAQEIEHTLQHGDFEDDKHLRKLSDANLRQDLIPARRATLEKKLFNANEDLIQVLQRSAQQWDRRVNAAKEEVFEKLIAAVLPFYGGAEKERLTRQEFERSHVPARDRFNNYYSFLQDHENVPPEQAFFAAVTFVERVERLCSELGWEVECPEIPRKKVASALPDENKKVRVRARVATRVDDIELKAGEEAELNEIQWLAISRHLEKLS